MDGSNNFGDLELRVTLAERALAETTMRLAELTNALADIANVDRSARRQDTDSFVLTAEKAVPFAIGFHQLEHDDDDRPYRWTGNGSLFELRFRLDRDQEWAFAMEVKPNEHVDILGLRAFADYMEIPVQIDESQAFIRGTIPARIFSRSVILTFHLPSTFVPSRIDPAFSDHRALGVIFYEIQIEPRAPKAIPGGTVTTAPSQEPVTKKAQFAGGQRRRRPSESENA